MSSNTHVVMQRVRDPASGRPPFDIFEQWIPEWLEYSENSHLNTVRENPLCRTACAAAPIRVTGRLSRIRFLEATPSGGPD